MVTRIHVIGLESILNDLKGYRRDPESLFISQHLGVLGTQNHGQSYNSLVAFSSSKDLKYLFFATTRTTRGYANLYADSRIAMLIDNRFNMRSDFLFPMGMTATGRAEEFVNSCNVL